MVKPAGFYAQFIDRAFGQASLPDHPVRTIVEATRWVAELPTDAPAQALAELTHTVASMNAVEAFTPGRRVRILMILDEAARRCWDALGPESIASSGKPNEGRDGDPQIIRALYECSTEFGNGYGIALNAPDNESKWIAKNLARVLIRNMRWLSRRLELAHMLRLPITAAVLERIHRIHRYAETHKAARQLLAVFDGDRLKSSVRQEYIRVLLLELANPASLTARQIELAYRIAERIAPRTRLEEEPLPGAVYALTPQFELTAVASLLSDTGSLYLDTSNGFVQLAAALERDMDRSGDEVDTLYGQEFTIQERRRLVEHVMEHWGPSPPKRRERRVQLASPVRLLAGFEHAISVIPLLEEDADAPVPKEDKVRLELETTGRLKLKEALAVRQRPARLIDASAGGMGIAIRRADASWAAHGALLAVCVEPGPEWALASLRRIFAIEDELRLGLQLLSQKPRAVWLQVDTQIADSPWQFEQRFENSFAEHFKRAIVLDAPDGKLQPGDILLEPGLATRGSQFDIRIGLRRARIRITRLHHDTRFFQRAAFEFLAPSRKS